jgi:hypothetical protein
MPCRTDELGEATTDHNCVGPGLNGRRTGHHKFLDTIYEARKRLSVAGRPKPSPFVVCSSPEDHRVLAITTAYVLLAQ